MIRTSHPKVLVVNCQAFNYASGPGITLSNLFRGWPFDRLATVHDDVLPISDDVCRQYYLLGDREARWTFSWARRAFLSRRQKNVTIAAPKGGATISGLGAGDLPRRLSSALETVRERLNPRDLLLRYEVSDDLRAWVRKFAPDIIYTQPANICFMSLACRLRELTGARLAIHFMDDWPGALRGSASWLRPRARRTRGWLNRILECADLRLTISLKMAEEYERRYGYNFECFHNPAPSNARPKPAEDLLRLHSPARIVYSGVISPRNQLDALRDLCRCVERLNRTECAARLHIYTQPGFRALFAGELASPAVVFEDYVSDQEQIADVYRAADLLVIPLSFSRSAIRFTALSMPTKTTSFMASGTPILVYAPRQTALADYAFREGWGLVVGEYSEEALTSGLRQALTDGETRRRLHDRALAVVANHHDSDRVRQRFRELLRQAVIAAGGRP